jgi:Ala-tRNA(Pro) deacylase
MNIADYLQQRHCWFERLPHVPTYTAQGLAQHLHVSGKEVAKAVLLRAGDGEYAVAVLPADKSIDFNRASELLGGTASLATEIEIAAQCTDCEFGVVLPFGSRYGMRTIVDSSLTSDEEIVFEGNTYTEAIRMRFDEFRRIERPIVAAFAVGH